MAAADLMTFDELRSALAQLDEAPMTAERELGALRGRQEVHNRARAGPGRPVDSLAEAAPDALDPLTPEERHRVYRMLRLEVIADHDGSLEAAGAFDSELSFCEKRIERPRL
jgi:hypothetical protein